MSCSGRRAAAALRILAGVLPVALGACAAMRPNVPGNVESVAGFAALSRIRADGGLAPAAPDPVLERAAAEQAGRMAAASSMAHDTGRGGDFASRMHDAGIGAAAENVAYAADLEKVFRMWETSTPHLRNMRDPRFARYGLASAPGEGGKRYWALVLGR